MNQLEFEAENAYGSLKRSLGDAIKSHRKSRRFSQEELALKAGLHRTYVTDVESGRRNISLVSIAKLARALDISIAELFSHGSKQVATSGAAQPFSPYRSTQVMQ